MLLIKIVNSFIFMMDVVLWLVSLNPSAQALMKITRVQIAWN